MTIFYNAVLIGKTFDPDIESIFWYADIEKISANNLNPELPDYLIKLLSLTGFVEEDSFDCITVIQNYRPDHLKDYLAQQADVIPFELTDEKIRTIRGLRAIENGWWKLGRIRSAKGKPDYIEDALKKQIRAELYYQNDAGRII